MRARVCACVHACVRVCAKSITREIRVSNTERDNLMVWNLQTEVRGNKQRVTVCVCVYMCARVCVCVRACVRACVCKVDHT